MKEEPVAYGMTLSVLEGYLAGRLCRGDEVKLARIGELLIENLRHRDNEIKQLKEEVERLRKLRKTEKQVSILKDALKEVSGGDGVVPNFVFMGEVEKPLPEWKELKSCTGVVGYYCEKDGVVWVYSNLSRRANVVLEMAKKAYFDQQRQNNLRDET
jgi:methyl coenzyme M reductase subunit C-like uncharacterized protein (methanogenesis marker protein 7)